MVAIKSYLNKIHVGLSNFIQKTKANNFEKKIVNTCIKFGTTSPECLWEMLNLFKQVPNYKIQGTFVECGVWKGAYLVFFQKLIEEYNLENRKIYAYDTFEGTPEPTDLDINSEGQYMKEEYDRFKKDDSTSNWNNAGLEEVKKNYFQNTNKNDNLVTIKGKVENTLLIKSNIPDKIAILKLDTCLYESIKIELENLYPRLQKHGILIIDNYFNYQGVKKATDDYFKFNSNLLKSNRFSNRVIIHSQNK